MNPNDRSDDAQCSGTLLQRQHFRPAVHVDGRSRSAHAQRTPARSAATWRRSARRPTALRRVDFSSGWTAGSGGRSRRPARPIWRLGGRVRARAADRGASSAARSPATTRRSDRRPALQTSPSSSCTSTGVPASRSPASAGSTMKQFACDIDDSTPEPCSPVVRTVQRRRRPRRGCRAGTRCVPAPCGSASGERRLERRQRRDVAPALQHQQRVADELVERHHHRHRIAGQAEEMRAADLAVRQRPPRLHRDLPEQHFAELGEQLARRNRLRRPRRRRR